MQEKEGHNGSVCGFQKYLYIVHFKILKEIKKREGLKQI